jgi:hypothetical protein
MQRHAYSVHAMPYMLCSAARLAARCFSSAVLLQFLDGTQVLVSKAQPGCNIWLLTPDPRPPHPMAWHAIVRVALHLPALALRLEPPGGQAHIGCAQYCQELMP